MSEQAICPMIGGNRCIEENCAWWLAKGYATKHKPNEDTTIYDREGCCSVKAIGWGVMNVV